MDINKKVLTLSISAIIGMNYVYSVKATDYAPINGGTTYLNNGDRVIYNNPDNTSNIIGIKLNAATDSLTINGAANINLNNGGQTTGVSVTNGGILDLGAGTVINTTGQNGGILGLSVNGSSSTVNGDNLTINVNSAGRGVNGINIDNGAFVYLTGDTIIDVNGNGNGLGIQLSNVSSLTLDKLTLNLTTQGQGVRIENGSALVLGSGSSITTTGKADAIFATGTGTAVNLDASSLSVYESYGVNAQSKAIVNLGSGTQITNVGDNSIGIWSVGNAKVSGDHLTINSAGELAIEALTGGVVSIGAGSHITSSSKGIAAASGSTIDFKGSDTERNAIVSHRQYATSAQGTNSVVNVENTDIAVDNTNGTAGSKFVGVWALNSGVVNVKDSSMSLAEGGYSVYAMNAGTVNLSGKTIINAGTTSGYALATKGGNSIINVIDRAIINGNIFASGAGSSINLDTTQGSVLTGYTTIDTAAPGASLNIKMADGIWNMTDDSQVNNLVLNNATINFSKAGYETLTVDSLSGTNGLFNVRTDIVGQQSDLIVVNGTAEGTYKLNVTNSGSSATTGNETLVVIKTDNNQANFSLVNKVELGAYEYGLRNVAGSPNDYELYASGSGNKPTLATTAQAAGSFLNIGYLTNYIENQTLLQRLGDLRNSEAMGLKGDGFWMKGFGGKLNSFSGTALDKFDMTYTGTQLGIDKQIATQNGRLLVGAMAGFTRTNPNYRQGNGDGKNYTAGLYATYLLDNGLYVDTVLKYNSMRNHFNVKDTAGQSVKGTGKTQGVSLSTEVGKRFWVSSNHQGLYFEPQAQLSYGYQSGDTVHSTNGLKVGLSHYNSTLGRVSGIVGYQIQGANPINVYLKTGVVREMSGGANYRFNDGIKNGHSFRSNWFDNGVGVNININKKHNIYAEADYSTGNHFDNAMLNVGYRYSF